jgi:hypothetical protein
MIFPSIAMQAIEFEIKRTKLRDEERAAKDIQYDSEIEAARVRTGGNTADADYKAVVEKIRAMKEKDAKKERKLTKKQDRVLFVGFYILLNLAEDTNVERKMVKAGLISYLIEMLPRRSADLLILSATFLKKLSLFAMNKNTMRDAGIISKLSSFLPCSSESLVTAALRLEFNLSFDSELRDKMIEAGHLPKLVSLLKIGAFRGRTLKVLYHLSVDDRCKSMLAYTDGVQMLMGLLINFPQPMLTKDLAGLAVNVSWNARNAEQMVQNHGLNYLMDRMENSRDPLLMKIIRNISQWSFEMQQELDNPEMQYRFRGLWSAHVKTLCVMAVEAPNHDLLIEILGTLANLTSLDLPGGWMKVLKDYQIFALLSRLLVPGMSQPDILLEVIMLFSASAVEPKTCDMIVSGNVLSQLNQLWKEKGPDDVEILLQLMHLFYRLILNDSSRNAAMYNASVVSDSIEYLSHANVAVSQLSESISAIVLELDRDPETQELGALGIAIRAKRFESYNEKWLQAVGIETGTKLWNHGTDYMSNEAVVRMNGSDKISSYQSEGKRSYGNSKYDDHGDDDEDDESPARPNYRSHRQDHDDAEEDEEEDDRSYANAGGGEKKQNDWAASKWK